MKIERLILASLIHDENYTKKVLPFLKPEYFKNSGEKRLLEIIKEFFDKYGKIPNKEVLSVELDQDSLEEDIFNEANGIIEEIKTEVQVEKAWLLTETEKFCRDRAIYNAILASVKILDDDKKPNDSIPLLLEDALGISFDRNVGHDFFAGAIDRYEYLHSDEARLRFDIEMFNTILGGRGLPKKTLTILLAETGAGKTLGLCHMAANFLTQGENVLYITLELSDMRIAERIDANLLDTELDVLAGMEKGPYLKGVRAIAEKTHGRLIIKEYPPATVHAGHFESLLNELKIKKNFVPSVVIVDYINLCVSQRYGSSTHGSYGIVKGIAEELRAIAVKHDVILLSATQMNRQAYGDSDADLTGTSESMGLPFTTDLFLALITNEELEKNGHLLVKQLKNRFGDISKNRRFLIGINRAKMKWTNIDEEHQNVMNESDLNVQAPPKPDFRKRRDYSEIDA